MASLKFKEVLCLLYSGVMFLTGAVLIGFSLVLGYKIYWFFSFIPTETVGPILIIFFLGLVHLFITWVGIKGPSKEHDFFIVMFIVFCVILLLIELSVGIWSMVLWARSEEDSAQLMVKYQQEYFKGQHFLRNDSHWNEWIRLENKFHCCGMNSSAEYIYQGFYPISCYKCNENERKSKLNNCTEINTKGCRDPFAKYLEGLMIELALIGFLGGLYQAAGIASFIIFYKALKKERSIRAANRASRLRQSLSAHASRTNPNYEARRQAPSAPT